MKGLTICINHYDNDFFKVYNANKVYEDGLASC